MWWNNGAPAILHEIERDGKCYVPPQKNAGLLANIVLSNGACPSAGVKQLAADLESVIAKFIDVDPADLQIIVSHVLSCWIPECFETVPYLWLVGPLGSAKTTLLKLLSCFSRRSVLAGDIRAAALYRLANDSDITLLIDELELDDTRSGSAMARLLRAGNTRDLDAIRNGERFSPFCFKVLASHLPPTDGPLASRALFVSMRPTTRSIEVLDEPARRQIIQEFQPRLLGFRFENLSRVKRNQLSETDLHDFTPRMKQTARVLLAPLQDDPQRQASLLTILRDRDDDNRVARSLEPEWLVVEALFRVCHEEVPFGGQVTGIMAGGVADEIREMLDVRGEEPKFTARKAGAVLSALSMKPKRIGNRGYRFVVNWPFRRKVHQLARQFGLDRRALVTTAAIEAGNAGTRCLLCEEFGLTAGLRTIVLDRPQPRRIVSEDRLHKKRQPIFDEDNTRC